MDNQKRDQHERSSECYLEKVADRYVFDAASGIYKQKTAEANTHRSDNTPGGNEKLPLWVRTLRDWPVLIVSILTLGLLVATVHYARKQWLAMNDTVVEMQRQTVEDKTALTDARDRFNKERRPFIWFSPPSQGATEPEGLQFIKIRAPGMGQAVWQWHFTNYGHSPANNLQLHSFIKIGNKPWEPTFGHPKTRAGVPLPPNKIDFAATISSPLNQTDFNSAVAAGKVSIRGVITYIDLAGTPYETDFCLVELNSGVQSYCPGNHIK